MRDAPGAVLARHFFASLFECGFLSEDGAESLKRALLGSLAVATAIGLLLTRVFLGKYAMLADGPFDAYERAVAADHAFLIAVPIARSRAGGVGNRCSTPSAVSRRSRYGGVFCTRAWSPVCSRPRARSC